MFLIQQQGSEGKKAENAIQSYAAEVHCQYVNALQMLSRCYVSIDINAKHW